jgi:hypothetical protein
MLILVAKVIALPQLRHAGNLSSPIEHVLEDKRDRDRWKFSPLSGVPSCLAFQAPSNSPNCFPSQPEFTRDLLQREAAAPACINCGIAIRVAFRHGELWRAVGGFVCSILNIPHGLA